MFASITAHCPSFRVRSSSSSSHTARRTRARRAATTAQATTAPVTTSETPYELEFVPEYPGPTDGRKRVVVLGSGWGAMTFIKGLAKDIDKYYDIVVVSPRNYFLYTPLLPAAATGTVEDRSVVEPVRRQLSNRGHSYVQAKALRIVPDKRALLCETCDDENCLPFSIKYDYLVNAIGSVPNTFGVPGVEENAQFFKEVSDAMTLRSKVTAALERASLPTTDEAEARRALTFAIVGGGPTGVELAAELYDMVREDVAAQYPKDLLKKVKIVVVELQDHILSMYDRKISEYATEQFKRREARSEYIQMMLNAAVVAVEPGKLRVKDKDSGEETEVPFGACVWSTGIRMHPVCESLRADLCADDPDTCPANIRSLQTDASLRVKGRLTGNRIFAVGDCATVERPKALVAAKSLFCGRGQDVEEFDEEKGCAMTLTKDELKVVLEKAAKDYPHLGEFANNLDKEWNTLLGSGSSNQVDYKTFESLLERLDNSLRSFPATAQVAKQESAHLAMMFNNAVMPATGADGAPTEAVPLEVDDVSKLPRFDYNDKGSLAYIGADAAVMDITGVTQLKGVFAGVAWKGFETISQISFRNAALVGVDWVRAKLFGRDLSRLIELDSRR